MQGVGGNGITFLVTIVLARLLTPEIFGLIAMLMIFLQVSQALVIAGFNQALIQKQNTDEEDYSSVFWLNLAISLLMYGILFLGAPLIAGFYGQPVLTKLIRVLCLVFVINAFSYVQEARLTKEMRFKTLTLVHIPSTVIGGVSAIAMAMLGFGVWSLVAMHLITRFSFAVQIWIYSKWKPLWVFNKKKTARLFAFGGNLMVSGILNTIFQNAYLVVIGKFFPLAAVGNYQIAERTVLLPSMTFSGALTKVAFPAFSSIQDDDQRLKSGFKKIIQQVMFWLCPAFVLAAILAEPLFRFVFTEKWMGAVPFFQILCVVGVFYPLNAYNLNIVKVKGRSDLFLRLEIIKKAIIISGIIGTLFIGLWALLVFQALCSIFFYFLNGHYSGKFIGYPVTEQFKDVFSILLLSLLVGLLVFFLDYFLSGFPDIVRILMGFGLGGGLYWASSKYFHLQAYLEFLQIIRKNF